MNRKAFFETIKKGQAETIKLYDEIEKISDGTVTRYRNILNAPNQSEGVQLAHKFRGLMASVKNYTEGVKHLNGAKFDAISKMEYQNLLQLVNAVEKINIDQYKSIYADLSKILYQ